MKVTTLLRTTAQLRGMIDELKVKRSLLGKKLKKGDVTVVEDIVKLEGDMNTIDFGFDLVDDLVDDLAVC